MVRFPEMIAVFLFMVLSAGMHEASHTKVAELYGNAHFENSEMNTWNPMPYVFRSWLSCIVIPGIIWFFGNLFWGGSFFRINPENMKENRTGYIAAVLAGPLMNLFLAIVCGAGALLLTIATRRIDASSTGILLTVGSFNFFLFLLNLIPFPPLDGASVITVFFPSSEVFFRQIRLFSFLVLIALLITDNPLKNVLLWPVHAYRQFVSDGIMSFIH